MLQKLKKLFIPKNKEIQNKIYLFRINEAWNKSVACCLGLKNKMIVTNIPCPYK